MNHALAHDPAELYRSVFAACPDALLLVDAQGAIVLANPAASQLLGYAAGALEGLPVDALVPDAIRPRHAAYRAAYGRDPRPRPMGTERELVARRRDGSEVMVEIALSPLQDSGLPYVVAAVRGIGDYPRVQQALRRAHYSEILARLGQLAVDTRDPQALLHDIPAVAAQALEVETAVIHLLSADRGEFRVASGVGLGDFETVDSRSPNRPDTPPGYVIGVDAPVQVLDAAGERRFAVPPGWTLAGRASALAVPLTDRGQTVGVLSVRSHTGKAFDPDQVRFMQALSNLLATSLQRAHGEAALNHAQRLESVGGLTGGIAHDFNNLLTVIQGNLQVLEEHPALAHEPNAQQFVASARRASRRAADLTAKLLAFSRRQLLMPSRVDVAALIESLADMLRRTLDQRIRIEVDVAAALPCLADAGQLEAALLNLAINARDAMPDGGRLGFVCRPCRVLPPELADETDGGVGYVEIDVSDSGSGMTEAVRERAFEPFFTTKELGRGTGLGLSTVYGFVRQSNGAVRLRSAPGAGTTVSLVLPRSAEAGSATAAAAKTSADLPAGLKVLLVEDEPEVRAVLRSHLRALGCRVTEAGTAEEALATLEGEGAADRPDLLLTDIALGPGRPGSELACDVEQRWPRTALLLMSGYASAQRGEFELLKKPFARAELAHGIARALARRDGG